jgi:uncharacterized C2H2 Zn-finger protein
MDTNDERDTVPMFKAAPITAIEGDRIVYCNRCGCSFLNQCSNPDHTNSLEKRNSK